MGAFQNLKHLTSLAVKTLYQKKPLNNVLNGFFIFYKVAIYIATL